MTHNVRLLLALVVAFAGLLAPLLPLVDIGGEAFTGAARTTFGLELAAPALFPLLSATTRQWIPRRPAPRALVLAVEAGWFVAIAIFGHVELAFTLAPMRYLPGVAAVIATELAGIVLGVHFGWRRPIDRVRR